MQKIIKTKLHIPQLRVQTIVRNRLNSLLNQGMHKRLTLVIAPAGFGKTTLISSWIHSNQRASAWLSLDKMDAEPTRFILYLIASIQTLHPEFGQRIARGISDQAHITLSNIISDLINELTDISQHITLVLDDYHTLESVEIDQALSFLINHLPPHIHLILTSRIEPNLPISRWRVSDELLEFRASDLRFTLSETHQYFDNLADVRINTHQIQLLEQRTEGWIAGLQLAGLTLKRIDNKDHFVHSFSGSHRYVMDYLTDEVLNQLSEKTITFLLKTSILQDLTTDLCNAITETIDAQKQLEMFEEMNLFIIPLDYERKWYRYHHLFSDLLQHRLRNSYSRTVIEALHRRACEWYETHGFISKALHHAHEVDDDTAIQLVIDHAPTKMENGESSIVFGWINTFSDDQILSHPYLSIKRAWQLLYMWQLEQLEPYLACADQGLSSLPFDKHTQNMLAELTAIQISKLRYQNALQDAIDLGNDILETIPSDNFFASGLILTLLGGTYANQGKLHDAIRTFSKALDSIQMTQNIKRIISVTHQLSVVYAENGQLSKGISILKEVLHAQATLTPAIGGLHSGIGLLRYEQNDFDSAIFHFHKTIELSQHETFLNQAYVTLSMIYLVQGNIAKSQQVFQKAEAIMLRWGASYIHILDGIRAKMALISGDFERAKQWKKSFDVTIGERFPFYSETLIFTYSRILIVQGREENDQDALNQAVQLLTKIEHEALSQDRIRSTIEAQILQALAYDADGQSEDAIKILQSALDLAAPEEYIRVFVEESQPMLTLLQHVSQTPFVRTLIENLLPSPTHTVDQSHLVEPLTDRELEIMQLIVEGYTNAEIADALVIAVTTVKKHVSNIYGKISVRNRTEAVKKSQELGIVE